MLPNTVEFAYNNPRSPKNGFRQMSVASFSVPTSVSVGGAAWAPQHSAPQANIPLRQPVSTTFGRGAVGAPPQDNSRGDLTGDLCTAVDLFSGANIASWDEKTSQCVTNELNIRLEVHYTAEGKSLIEQTKSSQHGLTVQELRDEIVVGKPGAGFNAEGPCFPATSLLEVDAVSSYGEVALDPISSLPLPALTALLLDAVLHHQKLRNTSTEVIPEGKSKKGKGKRGRQNPSITLLCPAGFNQTQRATLLAAAELCGRSVKNVFNRGVSSVAGGLYEASQSAAAGGAGSKGKVAVAGDLLDVLCGQSTNSDEEDPLVLYVHVYAPQGSSDRLHYDAVLVRCEGRAGAAAVGAPLGFERLCTVAARGGRLDATGRNAVLEQLRKEVRELISDRVSSEKAGIKVVLLDGLIARPAPAAKGSSGHNVQLSDEEALSLAGAAAEDRAEVVRAQALDAVTGASVLSAAELSSSKQYLERADGEWAIAYLLPVADGAVLGRDLGVRVLWGPSQDQDQSEVVLLPVGTRLWKEDAGVIPPGRAPRAAAAAGSSVAVDGVIKLDFKAGAAKMGQQSVRPPVGWPRVQVLERCGLKRGSAWRVLETLTPLLSCASANDAGVQAAEAVQSCSLVVRVDPATGAVTATQSKGPSTARSWAVWRDRLLLAFVLALPFILIGLWYASGYLAEWYSARQHAVWLLDFYAKNAPEKLKDPDYVARTAAKYKGRMFLLWRNLERAYGVKWPAPPGVLDAAGGN